jgi:hypothetical protein
MFWVGPDFSAYETVCLRSFLSRGHRILLYTPMKLAHMPEGVTVLDANEILPVKEIYRFTFPNGDTSPSIHANLFRYEMLRQNGGWYCDTDVVLLQNDLPAQETYFGWEDATTINNAILRFLPNAPMMQMAAEAARDMMTATVWGMSGPRLLTRLAHSLGIAKDAQPAASAYPVHTTEVLKLFDPACREELEERLAKADFLHLWNQVWKSIRIPKEYGPPEGSYLDSLFRTFDVRVPPYARLSYKAVASWFHDTFELHDLRQLRRQPAPDPDSAEQERLRALVAELTRILEQTRWERDEMLRSRSWRVTEPLRVLADWLRRRQER